MRSPRIMGLALSAFAALAMAACTSSGHPSTASPNTSARTSGAGAYQLPKSVSSLRIDGEAVAIDVTAQNDADAITVEEQLHGKATTTKDVSGTTATLAAKCPSGFPFGGGCSVDYIVSMPAQVALQVDNTAGEVTLQGPLANVTISTNAGRVKGSALAAGTYQVKTNAGEVNLAFVQAPNSVKVNSDVGEVSLTVPGGIKYAVTTHTTVGSAEVKVDQDSSSTHRLDVSTTVGVITIENG